MCIRDRIRGPGLQPPETELLERMKSRGGEVTDRFLLNFMEHQVSRIEVSFSCGNHGLQHANCMQTCVSTLAMRHIAIGGGVLRELNDLRAPMASVLDFFVNQQKELEQYRKMYGALPQSNGASGPARLKQVVEVEEDHKDINGGDQGENGVETDSDTEHG